MSDEKSIWHPITELPKPYKDVLLCVKGKLHDTPYCRIGCYTDTEYGWDIQNPDIFSDYKEVVLKWAELPELPKDV